MSNMAAKSRTDHVVSRNIKSDVLEKIASNANFVQNPLSDLAISIRSYLSTQPFLQNYQLIP